MKGSDMRTKPIAVVGLVGVSFAAFVVGVVEPAVSAQAGSFHVWTVTSGGASCRDMTNNLGAADRDAWRAFYANYVSGFITGANFVSYSTGARNATVGYDGNATHEAAFDSVEQYCAQNPAKNISEAVTRIYSQLVAQ
jgi:hypothetical protein